MNEILVGDALTRLKELPDESVHCCVTSPPYWGLRDYGMDGQIGMEKTPIEFVYRLVAVFKEVRRVLRADGTVWLNVGDSYESSVKGSGGIGKSTLAGTPNDGNGQIFKHRKFVSGLKPKDLVGIPWRIAFALQADGWWLRSDIIWSKPNPMPESITDRPTKAHEYLFLLAKSENYYYDYEAIKEDSASLEAFRGPLQERLWRQEGAGSVGESGLDTRTRPQGTREFDGKRNRRTVWEIATQPCAEAHFAVFPEALVSPCIIAGCPAGGLVLDPFMGSGTTAIVALKAGRKFIGIELNPEYAKIAEARIWQEKNQARLA